MLIEDHFDGNLIKDWKPINDSEFEEVFELDNICFPEYRDLDFIRDNKDTRGEIHRLYSYEHNKIIGYAVYGQIFDNHSAYILRIGVLPEFRRQSYASYIIDCIIIDLSSRQPKCPAVYADIRQSNQASMNLFMKSGFYLLEVRGQIWRGQIYNNGELSNCMYLRVAL